MDMNIDKARDIQDQLTELKIADIRKQAASRALKPIGACHWCSESFAAGDQRIYCDSDCESDHAKEQRMKVGR